MKFTDYSPAFPTMTPAWFELVRSGFDGEVPEVWLEIAVHNFAVLRRVAFLAKLNDEKIAALAIELAYELVNDFGGNATYIPSGRIVILRQKNAQVVSEFDGKNINQLARKHRVTPMRVRQILQEEADRKKKLKAQEGGR